MSAPARRAAIPRRTFLRTAALAAGTGLVSACGPLGRGSPAAARRGRLRIVQASHPVPGYDDWFDEHAARWGHDHDVDVTIDRLAVDRLVERAATEVAARRGHDLFGLLGPASAFEDHVIDHRDLIETAEASLGPMVPIARQTVHNPKTGRYSGFCDSWAPAPVLWRTDLWPETPAEPATWEDVLRASPALKARGHPVGIGLSQDLDSNMALLSLMACFGATVQDEESTVTIDRPETIEAVRFATELFRNGMTDEVLAWDALSNNRFLESGRGSLVVNPISALRSTEQNNPDLAGSIAVSPIPRGPVRRLGMSGAVGVYVIWDFARQPDLAGRFLLDLVAHSDQIAARSRFGNLPAFRDAVPEMAELAERNGLPRRQAGLLDASGWSANVGFPGHANPAIAEVVNRSVIPQMFARAASGRTSARDAVRSAHREAGTIFGTWRARGRI